MDDLHGKIMNIPCDESRMDMNSKTEILAYKMGHQHARHAAAELAAAALSQPAAQVDSSHSAGGECGSVQVPDSLRALCLDFIDKQDIHCAETIYQTDRVMENACQFIEEVCNIVGFKTSEDDEATP